MPNDADPQAFNRYSYVRNSPCVYIDPSGHCWGWFSFVRDIPSYDTTCDNVEMAWTVVTHPDATPGQKAGAGLYMIGEGAAHLVVIAGTIYLLWEGGVAIVGAVGGSEATATATAASTAACADADCTNELRAVAEALCADNDCTNEAQAAVDAGTHIAEAVSADGDPTNEIGAGARLFQATTSKLQHVFSRHAGDFGITDNWSKAAGETFKNALLNHMNGPNTQVIEGTYRGTINVIHYYDPVTHLNVMTDLNGNLISGWQLSAAQVQYLLSTGNVQ